MTKFTGLIALSALLLAAPAMAEAPSSTAKTTYDATANGGFTAKEKSENTDAAGTTTANETTKKVDVDNNGNKTTTVDIKHSTDPKGLMNKETTEIKNKAVEKDGKTEYTHMKSVDGKTVESTDDKTTMSK